MRASTFASRAQKWTCASIPLLGMAAQSRRCQNKSRDWQCMPAHGESYSVRACRVGHELMQHDTIWRNNTQRNPPPAISIHKYNPMRCDAMQFDTMRHVWHPVYGLGYAAFDDDTQTSECDACGGYIVPMYKI